MRFGPGRSLVAAALCTLTLAAPRPSHALFGFGPKQPPPPAPVAAVGSVEGAANYQARGTGAWVPLTQGQKVSATDIVKTEKGGKVVIAFSDGSKVQLGENANFQLDSLESKKVSLHLNIGLLDAWVAKVKSRRFQVRTPTAVASVRGTQLEVNVGANGSTEFFCFSGSIEVAPPSGIGRAVEVSAGQTAAAPTGGKVSEATQTPAAHTAPVEPTVAIPAPAQAPAPTTTPPGTQEGKAPPQGDGTTTTEQKTTTNDTPPPPPNPVQDQAVSGSTP